MNAINARSQGVVLIAVLWFIALMSLLVATLASEVRLTAKAVFHNQDNVEIWAKTLETLHLAEMELMIQRMPLPPEKLEKPLSERENPLLHFNGQVVQLSYPQPEGSTVRIYDHAGKINVRSLNSTQLRDLLSKQIGEEDVERLDALQQAWDDWKDADDLKRLNGAEKAYYETLDPPYEPRNGLFETLEEIRLIKGFDQVFKDIDLNTVFTIYAGSYQVNPNYATTEVLNLLPGVDTKGVEQIIELRNSTEIKSLSDLNEIIAGEALAKLQPWLEFGNSGSSIYTIAIQIAPVAEADAAEKADLKPITTADDNNAEPPPASTVSQYAFLATVQSSGYAIPPRILKIEPYGQLPSVQ